MARTQTARPRAGRRARGERGAIVPMVAVLLVVVIAAASLAVDLGQLRVGRQDMQALADVVAMDVVRQVDGRTAQAIQGSASFRDAVRQSTDRNSTTFGSTPVLTVELGTFTAGPAGGASSFTVASGATVPNAVRVSAETDVRYSFREGAGTVERTAVARTDAEACFGVGSFAARVRGDNTLTGSLAGSVDTPLLTGTVNLLTQVNSGYGISAVGYQGLLDAAVSAAELATALNAGSATQLADTTTTVGSFYAATAQVLRAGGNTADAEVLETLSQRLASAGSIKVGDLLSVTQGSGADALLNVFDLVTGSAFLLNGQHLLDVPSLAVVAGPLADVRTSLKLGSRPALACGRVGAVATTSQASTTTTAALAGPRGATLEVGPLLSAGLTIGPRAGSGITARLDLDPATARLDAVRCATPTSTTQAITLGVQSGLLSSTITVPTTVNLTVLGVAVSIEITYTVTSRAASQATSTSITVPPQKLDTLYPSTGALPFRLTTTNVTQSTRVVTGGSVAGLLNLDLVAQNAGNLVLPGIVDQLNAQLVAPLTGLLGAEVGGADVYWSSARSPRCNVPRLAL